MNRITVISNLWIPLGIFLFHLGWNPMYVTASSSSHLWGTTVVSPMARKIQKKNKNMKNQHHPIMITTLLGSTYKNLRGGASPSNEDYASQCERVKSSILHKFQKEMEELQKQIVQGGNILSSFGSKADTICNQALEQFALNAPDPTTTDSSSSNNALIYDQKLEELEQALDTPLQLIYMKLLTYIREKALSSYRSASRTSDSSDYEAMLAADSLFVREAEEATRKEGSDWDYSMERTHLQAIMNDIASSRKKLLEVQMKNAEKQSTAMAFLQQQQQMIQQLQMQLYGQTSPWNVGIAYRIPDTNLNLQGTYQQGRANVQLSCVPDEYAPMLGPNGFTNGVGPGNLGLSLNLSL